MLPVLEMDGKYIGQSNAIARYLARQYDLTGKDEKEALECDVLVDTLGDLKQGKLRSLLIHFIALTHTRVCIYFLLQTFSPHLLLCS